MHGPPSLAACCAFVRASPSWRRCLVVYRGAEAYSAIARVVSLRSIGILDPRYSSSRSSATCSEKAEEPDFWKGCCRFCNSVEWLGAREIHKASSIRNEIKINRKWLVGTCQTLSFRNEFVSTRNMFGFNSRGTQSCEGIKERPPISNSCPFKHHCFWSPAQDLG